MQFERVFAVPRTQLFAFHENPDNLALLLRGWTAFRMIANDGHIRVGSITRVEERIGPVRVAMTFEHFVYEPPSRFGERQIRGPFAMFEHIHEFLPAESGTILRDRIDVRLPWYLGGSLTVKLFVAPKLRRFFAFRHAELQRLVRERVVDPRKTS
ncbi:MAG: SRPBCC family protein [Candidatus Hydrogenedentota bacterium]